MVEFPHALVGAAIATAVPNPVIALPLALASHFVLDLVPHWNPHIYSEMKKHGRLLPKTVAFVFLDSTAALFIGFLIASRTLPDAGRVATILFGAFFAVLPDLLEAPYYFLRFKNGPLMRLVEIEHKLQTNARFLPGILTQVIVSVAALWWVFS